MANTSFTGPVISANGFIGAVTGNITGNVTGDIFASTQSLSGAGAVNVTDMFTSLTTSGAAQALTLANGTVGQLKIISHVVDAGSAVLTPTTAQVGAAGDGGGRGGSGGGADAEVTTSWFRTEAIEHMPAARLEYL